MLLLDRDARAHAMVTLNRAALEESRVVSQQLDIQDTVCAHEQPAGSLHGVQQRKVILQRLTGQLLQR